MVGRGEDTAESLNAKTNMEVSEVRTRVEAGGHKHLSASRGGSPSARRAGFSLGQGLR